MVLMTLFVAACTAETPEPPATRSPLRPSPRLTEQRPAGLPVLAIVDGRTVEFANGVRVRISMLAQPAACWADAAVAFAKKTLLNKPVRFSSITPGEVNLELPDGTDYALLAVREGVLRAQGAAGALAEAERTAAREKRGLWGPPCNGADRPAVPTAGPRASGPFDGRRRNRRTVCSTAFDTVLSIRVNTLRRNNICEFRVMFATVGWKRFHEAAARPSTVDDGSTRRPTCAA
jgi:endonuclease YncB( thermonuclease family)